MTTFKALMTPAALLATLTVTTAPAWADQDGRRTNRSGQESGRAVERGQGQRSETPRASAPRSEPRQEAPAPRNDSRANGGAQRNEPPANGGAPRTEPRANGGAQRNEPRPNAAPPRYDARPNAGAQRNNEPRRDFATPRAVPRRDPIAPGFGQRDDRRYDPRYQPRYEPRYQPRYQPRYAPRYDFRDWRSPYSYRPHYLYRQPYLFRPWFTIGFGIYAGYPVPYTYAYPYPVYGYSAPSAPVVVGPGSTLYGGVSLDIVPSDAEVYVDGGFAGLVSDFDGAGEPLTLVVGPHRIEIVAPGYETLTIDVDVQPGQTSSRTAANCAGSPTDRLMRAGSLRQWGDGSSPPYPIGGRFFRYEFLIAILPSLKVNTSHPVTSTRFPSFIVPVNVHSDNPRSPLTK